MQCINAAKLLPEHLLKEIQQYIQGEALYIPTCPSKRRKWGESSGAADYYKVRNAEIRSRFQEGAELYQLCEQYGLSIDSIRKLYIPRTRRADLRVFCCSDDTPLSTESCKLGGPIRSVANCRRGCGLRFRFCSLKPLECSLRKGHCISHFTKIYCSCRERRQEAVAVKITIEQVPEGGEPEIILRCNDPDEALLGLIYSVNAGARKLIGMNGLQMHIIHPHEVYYFEAVDHKVFIYCQEKVYESRLKLYEPGDGV